MSSGSEDSIVDQRKERVRNTIFLLEDGPTLRGDLAEFLRCHSYSCASTTDFADAAADVRRADPDLVLLDLGLSLGRRAGGVLRPA